MTPDYKYDEIVGSFADFTGGIEWRLTNQPTIKRYVTLGSIKHFDMSSFDPSVHNSISNAKRVEICRFKNGVKLIQRVWYNSTANYIELSPCLNYNGTDSVNICNQSGALGIISGTTSPNSLMQGQLAVNLLKANGIKFGIFTEYYYNNVVDGATSADSFGMACFIPIYSTDNPAVYQSWAHIESGKTFHSEGAEIPSQNVYYPLDNTPPANVFATRDIDSIVSAINTLNPTNPLNPSDVYNKGNKDEPAQDNDPSGPGGGGGNYDDNSDPVPFPDLPTGGALSSGAIKAFQVTPAIMKTVFEKLWNSSIFDIPLQFQKLVDNPIDCIISFHCIPVTPSTNGSAPIKLGNLNTEVDGAVIDNQYLSIDCGTLNIKEYWGSALDYSPYTKCEAYLPFVGIKELNIDDVMKSNVHIKYNIDVFTGDCLCNIMCGQSVLYKFSGNLKQDIPVSGRTNNMGIKGMIGIAGSFAAGAMGAAMGAPPVLAGVAAGISSAASVASSKIITSRSGSLSGSVGLLDDFRPFLIFHRPIQSLANKFRTFKGYPSNITADLSTLSGYTEVEYINLQNIPNATSAEMDEIKNLLKQGVLL